MNSSSQISLKLIKLNRINHWSTVYAMDEELTVRTLECHYCKKRISITTVPDFISFCDIDCAEKWKQRVEHPCLVSKLLLT